MLGDIETLYAEAKAVREERCGAGRSVSVSMSKCSPSASGLLS
jgi:hypothetical protein